MLPDEVMSKRFTDPPTLSGKDSLDALPAYCRHLPVCEVVRSPKVLVEQLENIVVKTISSSICCGSDGVRGCRCSTIECAWDRLRRMRAELVISASNTCDVVTKSEDVKDLYLSAFTPPVPIEVRHDERCFAGIALLAVSAACALYLQEPHSLDDVIPVGRALLCKPRCCVEKETCSVVRTGLYPMLPPDTTDRVFLTELCMVYDSLNGGFDCDYLVSNKGLNEEGVDVARIVARDFAAAAYISIYHLFTDNGGLVAGRYQHLLQEMQLLMHARVYSQLESSGEMSRMAAAWRPHIETISKESCEQKYLPEILLLQRRRLEEMFDLPPRRWPVPNVLQKYFNMDMSLDLVN